MYRNRLSAFLILAPLGVLLSLSDAAAQGNGRIEGYVLDSQHSEPLPGANAVIQGTRYGAATDLKGRFVIAQVPVGNYKLVVSYIGYRKKTIDITVEDGQTLKETIKLEFQAVEGEEVTVTAQAEGQLGAINQQLASNTIANIVSQTRIRELPDVNAAESIGRLPGVAINRSGGEATQVSIRGLSAKYNTVSINGVRVPASGGNSRSVDLSRVSSGGDDRSVDLSIISSNILDGIEVKKAITPDMDADVLGGAVDLRLKEAPEQTSLSVQAMGGYNRLQDYYGNYNFTGTASERFLQDRLGIIAGFNADDYDRSADKFSANYTPTESGVDIEVQNLALREETVSRGRAGGNILLDYRIPKGKIAANSFYNRLRWDGLYRINRMSPDINRHYYDIGALGGTTSFFTGGVGLEQDFDWIRYDVGAARTASRTENPNERTWHFAQENFGFDFSETTIGPDTPPTLIPTLATNDTLGTGLADVWVYDTQREENETSVQLNVRAPFRLGSKINGYLKTGGKLRWLDRMNDEERYGRNGLHYGNGNGPNSILTPLDGGIPEWGIEELVDQYGLLPISLYLDDYSRSNFLDGDYPLGFTVQQDMLERTTQVLSDSGQFQRSSIESIGRDYSGDENFQAAYFMAELNLGKHITLLPGVRWERDESTYHGQSFRQTTPNNIEGPPVDLTFLTTSRENEFWLPMVHLQVQPNDWLKVRLARTETLTRPDFIRYAPITSINSNQSEIQAANSDLKPAKAINWDLALSVYENHVGFFTVSAFHKDIKDLIFYTRYRLEPGIPILPGLNIPSSWLQGATPYLNTYINNPDNTWYRGIELDWQTHFWYLPSIFRGVVLNANYTYIESETERTKYYSIITSIPRPPLPPLRVRTLADSTRTTRMPDQPKHIANVTLGYDFKGFSARLSYLYQTDRVTSIDDTPVFDTFSGPYARWDLTLQQKLGQTGVQFFANFTNLNARPDENFRGNALDDPTYLEYYGFAIDVGARYRF